jgi:lipopolysaccharide transport system permease protein
MPPTASEAGDGGAADRVVVIEPTRRLVPVDLPELWRHRELLAFLVWRNVKVRYKQTAFGAAWAIFQPATNMAVFSIVFGRLARIPSDGVPYPLFVFAGLVPWTYFANSLMQAGNSLVEQERLVTKVWFPRVLIPLSAVLGGLVDVGVALIILGALMAYYGYEPTLAAAADPLFLLLGAATALAVGLWLSALNVQYRDVRYGTAFMVQLWLISTPVAYPSSLLSSKWHALYGLNPMAGVVEGFRWALLGTSPPAPTVAVSAATVVVLLVGGLYYFRRMERTFADVI